MFNNIKLTVAKDKASASTMKKTGNGFIDKSMKKNAITYSTGNGAKKYTTTGSDFVDQFGKASNYRKPRSFQEVSKDMEILWEQNPYLAVCMVFYLRLISRVVQFFNGVRTTETQRGQGLKNEGMMRMLWIGVNHPDTFWKNINLYVAIASWKDIFQMLSLDVQYHTWKGRVLDWNKFSSLLAMGLSNENTSELIKKYMPQIKSSSNIKTVSAKANTIVAKWLCSELFGQKNEGKDYQNYKKYRKLKSSGTAHQWQQLISRKALDAIDFGTIHGRALAKLASSKFLANHKLTAKYEEWINTQPTAKYTGYVYELFQPLGMHTRMSKAGISTHQIITMNKQFLELVAKAKDGLSKDSRKFIGVLDTSASMTSPVPGLKVSAYSVGKSLTLFMSYLLDGPFAGHYLEFNHKTRMKQWKGTTPVDQLCAENSSIVGGTNFQSVAKHFVDMKKQGVAESDFPTGIVCFSDGCFNSTGTNKTNHKGLLNKLRNGGFSKAFVDNFQVILWDIPNGWYKTSGSTAFEDFADCPNLFHVSGLDPSALGLLTGTKSMASIPKNSEELMRAALSQEVMQMIEV